ncbi:MAG: HAD-IIIA family hydrolase [Clostridia bacterium]|nr:HAD-IIIA family hydrolase [Clostridia bacterium]
MKADTIIFDLDGTILDTLEDLKNSVNYALSNNNLPKRSFAEVRSFVGNGIRLLVERAVPTGTDSAVLDNCFADFKAHYKENSANNTKPYDGVIELLKQLKSKGYKLAVVSNKADFAVQMLVEDYFNGIFDYAVGEREGIRRKPCPDSVNDAIFYLASDKNSAVYVGDSEVDVETARNSGIPCVAVTWGFRDKSVLTSLSPEYIIDKPSQLMDILD